MSELVARLAVAQLRTNMFPLLSPDIQKMFPLITDPILSGENKVPQIIVGEIQDLGVGVVTPLITVNCSGVQEGLVNVYRHLDLRVDIWCGGNLAPGLDGRRLISNIYEYVNRALQNVNWSGRGGALNVSYVQIKRCFETQRSPILFEPATKMYHIANGYRVEALSQTWY